MILVHQFDRSVNNSYFVRAEIVPILAAFGGAAKAVGSSVLANAGSLAASFLSSQLGGSANSTNKMLALRALQLQQYQSAVDQSQNARDYAFQREQFEYQKGLNQLQMDREDRQYQRTVKDMNAAGINPIIMNGASTGSLSFSGSSGAGSSGGSYGASANQQGNDFNQLKDVSLLDGLQALSNLSNDESYRKNLATQDSVSQTNAKTSSESLDFERQKYNDNKDGNAAAQSAQTRSTSASATAQELTNKSNDAFYKKTGMTMDQFKDLDWQTALTVIAVNKGKDVANWVRDNLGSPDAGSDKPQQGVEKVGVYSSNERYQEVANNKVDEWRRHNPKAYNEAKAALEKRKREGTYHGKIDDEAIYNQWFTTH